MTRTEITRKFDEIVDFAGVEKFFDTPVKRYFSDMKVCLGFAAAHLEPEILLVDEVLSVEDVLKIGILTYWGVPNYGAYAQAYAFNAYLRSLGMEVQHIAYLHPSHQKLYAASFFPFKSCLRFWNPKRIVRSLKTWHIVKERNKAFEKDLHHIPHTSRMNARELRSTHFDCVITGSDAIWEFSIPKFGDDEILIGNGIDCSALISYATSFGTMSIKDEFPPFIQSGLKNYRFISVRDANSADIVEQMIGYRPEIVLDPSLLWDFPSDPHVPAAQSLFTDHYILVYASAFDDKTARQLRSFAQNKKLKLVAAGLPHSFCDFSLQTLGPLQWISMFKHASYVATNTFHGCLFSLIYQKPYLMRLAPYVVKRATWLLKQIDLYELFENGETPVQNILDSEFDFKKINNKLNILREQSKHYIRNALQVSNW